MFCFFYKWRVSRFLDQARAVSPGVDRHLSKCNSCGDFYHSTQLVAKQLTEEKKEVIQPLPDSFTATIMSLVSDTGRQNPYQVKRRLLLPLTAAATIAVIILVSFLWLVPPPQQPLGKGSQFPLLANLQKREQAVQNIVQQIESPIQLEARQLKESIQSAASYLRSCLDFKISDTKIL